MLSKQKRISLNLTLNVNCESFGIDINQFIALPKGYLTYEASSLNTVANYEDLWNSPLMFGGDIDEDIDDDDDFIEEFDDDEELGEGLEDDIDEFDLDEEFGYEEEFEFDEEDEEDDDEEVEDDEFDDSDDL